jgi:putative transcriptional regulator
MENMIRHEREARGWTQASLATRLRVSRQTVNALEAGIHDPSLPLAFRISRLFGHPIEHLFFPDDDPSGPADELVPDAPRPDHVSI